MSAQEDKYPLEYIESIIAKSEIVATRNGDIRVPSDLEMSVVNLFLKKMYGGEDIINMVHVSEELEVSMFTVSHTIRSLREAGLIRAEGTAGANRYRILFDKF